MSDPRIEAMVETFVNNVSGMRQWVGDRGNELSNAMRAAIARTADGPEPVAGWEIDRTTDSPILMYEKCSVIQDDQALYVMSLLNAAALTHPLPDGPEPVALPFVVKYRRKDDGVLWIPMAAFDREGPAERYCASCAAESSPWEYCVVEVTHPVPDGPADSLASFAASLDDSTLGNRFIKAMSKVDIGDALNRCLDMIDAQDGPAPAVSEAEVERKKRRAAEDRVRELERAQAEIRADLEKTIEECRDLRRAFAEEFGG